MMHRTTMITIESWIVYVLVVIAYAVAWMAGYLYKCDSDARELQG